MPSESQSGAEYRFDLQHEDGDLYVGEFRYRAESAGKKTDRHSGYFQVAALRRGVLGRESCGSTRVSGAGGGRILWEHEDYRLVQPSTNEVVGTTIVFSPALFGQMLGAARLHLRSSADATLPVRHFDLSPVGQRSLWKLAGLLDREPHSDVRDMAAKELALIVTADAITRAQERVAALRRPRVRNPRHVAGDVRAVIAEQYGHHLTLESIGRQVHMSPFHLCRTFRRETGRSIYEELTSTRLCAALEAIVGGAEDLSDLAAAVGFSSRGHLGHVFKRRFGVPPSAFRRQVHS